MLLFCSAASLRIKQIILEMVQTHKYRTACWRAAECRTSSFKHITDDSAWGSWRVLAEHKTKLKVVQTISGLWIQELYHLDGNKWKQQDNPGNNSTLLFLFHSQSNAFRLLKTSGSKTWRPRKLTILLFLNARRGHDSFFKCLVWFKPLPELNRITLTAEIHTSPCLGFTIQIMYLFFIIKDVCFVSEMSSVLQVLIKASGHFLQYWYIVVTWQETEHVQTWNSSRH